MPRPLESALDVNANVRPRFPTSRFEAAAFDTDEDQPPAVTRRAVQPCRHSLALERMLVEMMYRQVGCPAIQFVLWDGTVLGDFRRPIGRVLIREPGVLRRLFVNACLGFGEAYSAAKLVVEGDLIEVLTELNRGLSRAASRRLTAKTFRWPWSQHSFAKSKASVYHHYDIGNDFYQLWLDRQLVYTCAYYAHPDATLDEAQSAKLDYVSRKLRLKPGETVAEAGCGWGGLALHMARHYGVSVRAFNLSREQLAYARHRAQADGLGDRVEFIEDDYRNITGKYDAFVSVGMLEHVGAENYRDMGKLISGVLTEQGRGLIHSIGRNVARPLDSWTLKYIFPGAYAPSLREMMDLFETSGFSVLDVENLRPHYARTCADWLARFDQESDRVRQMFDEKFVRMWRLYLASASASFLSGDLQLFQILFARDSDSDRPWTRQDWYEGRHDQTTDFV